MSNETTEERFWSKVDRRGPDECWEWTAGRHTHGYGVFYLENHAQVLAHRESLTLSVGSPPEGKPYALHACDNPPCCNPAHLHWGDHAENMRESAERGRSCAGRSNLSHCPHGHQLSGSNIIHGTKTHKPTGRVYQTRSCRECNRQYLARRRAARKEVA